MITLSGEKPPEHCFACSYVQKDNCKIYTEVKKYTPKPRLLYHQSIRISISNRLHTLGVPGVLDFAGGTSSASSRASVSLTPALAILLNRTGSSPSRGRGNGRRANSGD